MRVLILGVNGLLGSNLARCLSGRGITIVGSGRQAQGFYPQIEYHAGDLLEPDFAARLIAATRPDGIINCVGLADVNLCEAAPTLAKSINTQTASHLARAAAAARKRLLHISTDHLFAGDRPLRTETDPPAPVNEYGRSKLAGEKEVLAHHPEAVVIRTNFYGWSPTGHATTFAEWLYDSLTAHKPISLFTDYFFNSIEVSFLASALEEVLKSDFHGILNIAGTERRSKYEFGQGLAGIFKLSMENVTPSRFKPESLKVQRPQDLSLSIEKFARLFKTPLPSMQDGLTRLLAERTVTRGTGVAVSGAKTAPFARRPA